MPSTTSKILGTSVPGAALLISALAGCAPTVDVPPAVHSNDARCAPVMIALPDQIAELDERSTNSQATAAWGEPSAVVLRCGVEPLGPTTDRCVTVNDVDWVVVEEEDNWRLTTYGRDPAIEVLLDTTRAASSTVLVDLAPTVGTIEQTRRCLSADEATLPSS